MDWNCTTWQKNGQRKSGAWKLQNMTLTDKNCRTWLWRTRHLTEWMIYTCTFKKRQAWVYTCHQIYLHKTHGNTFKDVKRNQFLRILSNYSFKNMSFRTLYTTQWATAKTMNTKQYRNETKQDEISTQTAHVLCSALQHQSLKLGEFV